MVELDPEACGGGALEVTRKRSDLVSLKFSMGTQARLLWRHRELHCGRAEVTAVGKARMGFWGTLSRNRAGVPRGR